MISSSLVELNKMAIEIFYEDVKSHLGNYSSDDFIHDYKYYSLMKVD